MTNQTERDRLTTLLAEARQALRLAEKRGKATEIIARRKVVSALEDKLAPGEVVHIAETNASNAKIDTVRIAERGEYVNKVWTPTPKQATREDVKLAEQALDAVNKKWLG